MATANEIVLRIVVRDGQNATRIIRDIGNATNGMADVTRVNADRMQQGLNSISGNFRGVGAAASTSADSMAQAFSRARSQMLGLIGASSAVAVGMNVIQMADEYKTLEARLHLVTGSQTEFNDAQAQLAAMSDNTRQSLSGNIDLYFKMEPALKRAGMAQADVFKAVDSVSKALVVGGSNAIESRQAIIQFGQALGEGALRGQDMNSIMAEGRGITMLLMDALHMTTAQFRKAAEEGKISTEIIGKALLEQNDAVSEKFAMMPVTVGQAIQVVKNNLLTYVGNADSASGATSVLSNALIGLSGHLSTVANIGGIVAAIYTGRMVSALVANTAAYMGNVAAARATAIAEAQAAQVATAAATERTAAAERTAAMQLVRTQALVETTAAERVAALSALGGAQGTNEYAAAVSRSIVAHEAAAAAEAEHTLSQGALSLAYEENIAAVEANRLATLAAANAGGVMATASKGLSAALALVGGPWGAATLAVVGLAYGLKYLKDEEENSKDAIKDSHGEWLKYADITDKAKQLNLEYTTASKSKKQAIDDERKDLSSLTEAEIKSTAATLGATQAKLAAVKAHFASQDYTTPEDADAAKAVESSYQLSIDQQITNLTTLNDQLKGIAAAATDTAKADDLATEAINKKTKATKQSIEVIHKHGDALKSAIESLAKQRIELEQGKLAAEYFTHRISDLSEAESKAASGAGQYNAYLTERKKLAEEAIGITGGLIDKYNVELSNAGLVITDDFSAAESIASKAVSAAEQYSAAIKNASKTFESSGDSLAAGATGALAKTTADFDALFAKASQATGVSAAFIKAIAQQETGGIKNPTPEHRATVLSPAGAGGVMQLMPDTADGLGVHGNERFDPEKNIMAGAQYLKQMLDKFHGSEALASAAYNAGPGAVQKHGDSVPPFAETQNYVRKVAAYTDLYRTNTEAAKKVVADTLPYWETLQGSAKKTESTVVDYAGSFDDARVSAGMLHGLINDKMGNAAKALIKSATEHTAEVTLTGEAYRRQQLNVLQYNQVLLSGNKTLADAILLDEQQANYVTEKDKLEKDAFAAKNGMAAQYNRELTKQNLNQGQIADLVQRKMQGATDKILHDTQQQTLQLSMSAVQWRRLELSQDGYNTAQITSIVNAEKLLATTKRLNEASTKIGDSLLSAFTSAALGGEHAFAGLKDTLKQSFADLVLTPTIKPLTSAVSQGIQGMLSGKANPWGDLKTAGLQTWSGMKAGGMSGAFSAAGAAGGLVGLLGGNKNESLGASIGAGIGNVLLPGLGGIIGGALGTLAGSLFGGKWQASGSGVSLAYGAGNVSGQNYTDSTKKGGLFTSTKHKTDYSTLDSALQKQLNSYFDGVEKGIADQSGALVKLGIGSGTTAANAVIAGFSSSLSKVDLTGKSDAERQTLLDQWSNGVTDALYKAVLGAADFSALDALATDGEATAATFARLVTQFTTLDDVAKNLDLNFHATGTTALTASNALVSLFGGLDALVKSTDFYYQNFFTEEERKQKLLNKANVDLAGWNKTLGLTGAAAIDTTAEMRQYVSSLDLTTASGEQAYQAALGYAQAVLTVVDAQDVAAKAQTDAATAAAQAQLDAAKAALEQQSSVFGQYWSGIEAITGNYQTDLKALETTYADQKQAYDSALQAATGLRNALLGLKLSDLSTLTPENKLAEARTQYADLLDKAKGGDVTAASKLQAAGEELLKFSRDYYASGDPYSADFAAVQAGWESVAGLLEGQKDPQQDYLAGQRDLIAKAEREYARLSDIFAGIVGGNDLQRLALAQISSLPTELAGELQSTLDGLRGTTGTAKLSAGDDARLATDKAKAFTDQTAEIISLYQTLLGRLPDTSGLNYWVNALKNGFGLGDVATSMTQSTEYKNSHYSGLASVPYDGYKATLHKDEAVIDARSMFALRKYGIPAGGQGQQPVVVNVDLAKLEAKLEKLTATVEALKAENAQHAQTATTQRNAQLNQFSDTERAMVRSTRMVK